MFDCIINTFQINVRENRSGNQEWTIQKHWQHWAYKTQDEDNLKKKKKKNSTQHYTKKVEQHKPCLVSNFLEGAQTYAKLLIVSILTYINYKAAQG